MMQKIKSPSAWLHGLGAFVITAIASVVITYVQTAKGDINWDQLSLQAITGGLLAAALYLKQSPLPSLPKEKK